MIRIGCSAVLFLFALATGYFSMAFWNLNPRSETLRFHSPLSLPFYGLRVSVDTSNIKPDFAGSEDALILAANNSWRGQFQEADRLYKMALDIRRKELGPANHQTLVANMCYFNDLMRQSRYDEAEKLAREAMDALESVPSDLWFLGTSERVSDALVAQKKFLQALEIQRRILLFEEKYSPIHCIQTEEKILSIKNSMQ